MFFCHYIYVIHFELSYLVRHTEWHSEVETHRVSTVGSWQIHLSISFPVFNVFLFNTWGSRLDQPYPRIIFVGGSDGVTDPSRGRPASCAKFAIFFFPICLASHQYCKNCKNVVHHIIGQLRYVYVSGNNIGEIFHTLNLSLSPIATSQLAPNTAATSSLQKSTRSCL